MQEPRAEYQINVVATLAVARYRSPGTEGVTYACDVLA